MKITAIVEALVDAGATPEMILAAVRSAEEQKDAAAEAGKEKARARWHRWSEKQPRSNVGKRKQTLAGVSKQLAGEGARVEDKTSSSEIEPQKEESKETARRTRLPNDFKLPGEWFQWALQRGLPAQRIPIEFEKLVNWAANAPSSKALKADWFKAWKNWVISAIDALPRAGPAPPKDSVANAATRRLEALRNERQNGSGVDDHQQAVGLLSGDGLRLVG